VPAQHVDRGRALPTARITGELSTDSLERSPNNHEQAQGRSVSWSPQRPIGPLAFCISSVQWRPSRSSGRRSDW
jgi:hypothetical protein